MRRLHHLRIGERDVVGQQLALGREAERRAARAADAAPAIDERIEHQAEELVHQLEARLAGCRSRPRQTASVSAFVRLLPVRPNTLRKFGGSVPPLLKKVLSVVATFCWFCVHAGAGAPSAAVRSRITSLSV